METLTYLWEETTNDFTTTQKRIIGAVVAFIVTAALSAFVLLAIELTK